MFSKSLLFVSFVQFKCKNWCDLRAFPGAKFSLRVFLRVKELTYRNSVFFFFSNCFFFGDLLLFSIFVKTQLIHIQIVRCQCCQLSPDLEYDSSLQPSAHRLICLWWKLFWTPARISRRGTTWQIKVRLWKSYFELFKEEGFFGGIAQA